MSLIGPDQISSEDAESVCQGSFWDNLSSSGKISPLHGLSEHFWQHGTAERSPSEPRLQREGCSVLPSLLLEEVVAVLLVVLAVVVAVVAAPAGPCSH